MSSSSAATGQIIAGRYRLLDVLGMGGMGVVYRAEQLDAAGQPLREVAVKMLRASISSDADFSRRFLREVRVAARLSSQHTVTIFDSGTTEAGQLFFSMELIRGRSLLDELRDVGTFPLERATKILVQICDALTAAHTLPEPVVHRDLKLENVFLEKRGGEDFVKVGDFGIAKVISDATSTQTQVGASPGTPAYMAPEQWRGDQVDARTDLYALGVIAYEMLSGALPFSTTGGPAQLMYQHLEAVPKPLPESVPDEIRKEVTRLLAKKASDRPGSARDAKQAFEAASTTARVRIALTPRMPTYASPPVSRSSGPPGRPPTPPRGAVPSARPSTQDPPAPPQRSTPAPPPSARRTNTPPLATSSARATTSSPLPQRPTPNTPIPLAQPRARRKSWMRRTIPFAIIGGVLGFLVLGHRSDRVFVAVAGSGIYPAFLLLLHSGGNVNAANGDGKTVLMTMSERGNAAAVQALLAGRAEPDPADSLGNTALLYGAKSGDPQVVRLLLERQADPNVANEEGRTPLMEAAAKGEEQVVTPLLNARAKVDAQDREGRTALMDAAERGHVAAVGALVRAGSNVRLKDTKGQSAKDLALANRHEDAAKLLQ